MLGRQGMRTQVREMTQPAWRPRRMSGPRARFALTDGWPAPKIFKNGTKLFLYQRVVERMRSQRPVDNLIPQTATAIICTSIRRSRPARGPGESNPLLAEV